MNRCCLCGDDCDLIEVNSRLFCKECKDSNLEPHKEDFEDFLDKRKRDMEI